MHPEGLSRGAGKWWGESSRTSDEFQAGPEGSKLSRLVSIYQVGWTTQRLQVSHATFQDCT